MLRIFTLLRDAFEPPSEKERRLLHVRRRDGGGTPPPEGTGETGKDSDEPEKPSKPDSDGDDPTKPQRDAFHEKELGVMNSGTETREDEPTGSATGEGEGAGEPPEGEIHGGEEAREPEAPRIRIKAEALVEKANSALETIAKIKAILGDKEFMNRVREAAKRDTKIQDLLTSFEEDAQVCDDAGKTIRNLKSEAEQFVLWQNPTERTLTPNQLAAANVRARCIVCKPESPEETDAERQIQQKVHEYLTDPTTADQDERWNALNIDEKTPTIGRLEELARIDETLEKMDETLTGYDTGLKVYLKQIQQLKDDIEKGGEISPPQQEWGGGSFTLKLIHFVYLAMAVKKIYDTWKKQWEYDFERAVGDCAAAISPWVAPTEVTQRLTDEMDANIEKVKKEKKELYSHLSFEDLHAAILTPNPDPAVKMAQLEVAAEKGWLYGIEDEGATQTVLGLPLGNFIPPHWHKTPSRIIEFYRELRSKNGRGAEERQKEGELESGLIIKRAGTPQVFQEIRRLIVEEKEYWKAIGMIKHAFQSKVDVGEVGGGILATVMSCIQSDSTFAKMISKYPNLLIFAGNTAAGYPSPVLYHLKIANLNIQQYASRIARGSGSPEDALEGKGAIAIKTWLQIKEEVEQHGGIDLDDRDNTGYTDNELTKMGITKEQYRSSKFYQTALARAIGRVMECQEIRARDGHIVSVWSNRYQDYRKGMEEGDPGMRWDLNVSGASPEHFGRRNAFRLQQGVIINELFSFPNTGSLSNALKAGNVITDIIRQYDELRNLASQNNTYEELVMNFIKEMRNRLCITNGALYNMLTHQNFRNIEQLDFRGLIRAGILTKKDLEAWARMGGPGAQKLLDEL